MEQKENSQNFDEAKIDAEKEQTFLFRCPECESIKSLDINLLGKKIDCPFCAEEVIAEKAATKNCPFCKNQIKFNATVCKFCKKIINESANTTSPADTAKNNNDFPKIYTQK
jgi:hypothetical protein